VKKLLVVEICIQGGETIFTEVKREAMRFSYLSIARETRQINKMTLINRGHASHR